MDSLVNEFLSAGVDEREAIWAKLKIVSEELIGHYASYEKVYLKAAKKITKKSVSTAKADEFIVNKNILSSFLAQWWDF